MSSKDILYDCIIEIPQNSFPIKYEFDKNLNQLRVDRIINVAMQYPVNYGFIPNTLSNDGDPIDILLISQFPLNSNCVIKVRAVGVLIMEDEAGFDEKILCVPDRKIDPYYDNINDINDINKVLLDRIKHFFERYKDLESNKWVKVNDFKDKDFANNLIKIAYETYHSTSSSVTD